jgi:hypothetical protein
MIGEPVGQCVLGIFRLLASAAWALELNDDIAVRRHDGNGGAALSLDMFNKGDKVVGSSHLEQPVIRFDTHL